MTRFSDAAGGTDLDQAAFRNAMGLLVTGVAVITARDPGTGEPRGMTANATFLQALAYDLAQFLVLGAVGLCPQLLAQPTQRLIRLLVVLHAPLDQAHLEQALPSQ